MRALLDINVLIALHDRDHIHHERAALWLEAHIADGWAQLPNYPKWLLAHHEPARLQQAADYVRAGSHVARLHSDEFSSPVG
jgi:hypothetical protein